MININQKSGGGVVTYGAYLVQNGLIYNFDAANPNSYPITGGLTWSDLSFGIKMSLVNGATFTSINNGVISFDGINDYAIFDGSNISDSAGTIMVWSYLNAVGSNKFIFNSIGSGTNRYYIRQNSSGSFDGVRGISSTFSATFGGLTTSTWYNFALTWNINTMFTYIDGLIVASASYTGAGTSASTATYLGNSAAITEGINANIANCIIYNRTLSNVEVLQNYKSSKSRYGK